MKPAMHKERICRATFNESITGCMKESMQMFTEASTANEAMQVKKSFAFHLLMLGRQHDVNLMVQSLISHPVANQTFTIQNCPFKFVSLVDDKYVSRTAKKWCLTRVIDLLGSRHGNSVLTDLHHLKSAMMKIIEELLWPHNATEVRLLLGK